MNSEDTIHYLLNNLPTNPAEANREWEWLFIQMTDEELKAFIRIIQLDMAGILTKNDLEPAALILQKYIPNTIVLPYEDSDPLNG